VAMDKYILGIDGRTPVLCNDLLFWARWFEKADRHVAQDEREGVRISTVFLGLDHNWSDGPPLLFETMIFGGVYDGEYGRCSTWEEAEAMHQRMVAHVQWG
jgi:hypothetical protein